MSNSSNSIPRPDDTTTGDFPRAVIHKNILDEAQASPDASINQIASRVSGASSNLVERVLDDYGDPAETEDQPKMPKNSAQPPSQSKKESTESIKDEVEDTDLRSYPKELTDKQRRTLRVIYENPQATQMEIAEKLDVTNVTVCNRVNEIDGFDWKRREEFVNQLFDSDAIESNSNSHDSEVEPREDSQTNLIKEINTLSDQLTTVEHRLSSRQENIQPAALDSELATKVFRACLHSDEITDEEEVKIIELIFSTLNSDA